MKKLFVLLILAVFFCTGFIFSCDKCEELESEIYHLEEENHELRMLIEDSQQIPHGVLEEIYWYLYGAEEYLNGQFLDVEPDEALRIIREAQDYLSDYVDL